MLTIPELRDAIAASLRRLDPQSELIRKVYATYVWRQTNACMQTGYLHAAGWIIDRARWLLPASAAVAQSWNLDLQDVPPDFLARLADAVSQVPEREFVFALQTARRSEDPSEHAARVRMQAKDPSLQFKDVKLDTHEDVDTFVRDGLEGYWTNWNCGLGWDPW